MTAPPHDFFGRLPATLPKNEPYCYLSARQQQICERHSVLAAYAPHLPGWVPHRRVADALQHPHSGIESALQRLSGQSYVWCTEFENVHTFWKYSEPGFAVDGKSYCGSEDFFHKQKPSPFDKALWDGKGPGIGRRDEVMRTAVQIKFADPALRELLISSHPHPLLSIKGDDYWGVRPTGVGHNMLAVLLMELRQKFVDAEGYEIVAGCAASEESSAEPAEAGHAEEAKPVADALS